MLRKCHQASLPDHIKPDVLCLHSSRCERRGSLFSRSFSFSSLCACGNPPGLARISSAACRATPGRSSWSSGPSGSRRRFLPSASSCPSARSAPKRRCVARSPKTRSLRGEARGEVGFYIPGDLPCSPRCRIAVMPRIYRAYPPPWNNR